MTNFMKFISFVQEAARKKYSLLESSFQLLSNHITWSAIPSRVLSKWSADVYCLGWDFEPPCVPQGKWPPATVITTARPIVILIQVPV
jgi:hypothetical protein